LLDLMWMGYVGVAVLESLEVENHLLLSAMIKDEKVRGKLTYSNLLT